MAEFLQSYGIWIFLGLLFSLMLWGHSRGHGMGCCGGGYQHDRETSTEADQLEKDEHGSGCH
jgi:hypothetical protein